MKFLNVVLGIIGACITITSHAQDDNFESVSTARFYFKVYGAYGLLTPGSFKGVSINDDNDVNIVNVKKKGMGGGVRAGAGIGFIINEYINVGVDGEYLMGNPINIKVNALTGASVVTQGVTTYNHKIYSVIPNIVFKALSKPTYNIYNRIGLVFAIPQSVTEEGQSEYHFKNNTVGIGGIQQTDSYTSYNGVYKLKNTIGYQGVLGIQMKMAEDLRGFFEVAVYGLSFNMIKYEDVQRLVTRTDFIKAIPTPTSKTTTDSQKFEKSYVEVGVPSSDTQPKAYMSMNAITVGIGFAYRF